MKTNSFFATILLCALMPMGYYVKQNSTITVPKNIWINDTLFLVADRDNGVQVYSVQSAQNPKYLSTIPVNRNSGVASVNDLVFVNSNDSIVAYKIGASGINQYQGGIKLHPHPYYNDVYLEGGPSRSFFSCGSPVYVDASAENKTNGGGSMSVFSVSDTFLYYIDNSNLYTVSFSNPKEMKVLSTVSIGWGDIETIFPSGKYLFIGGRQGMYIYNRFDPSSPKYEGMISHFKSCDPVVVRGATAYVTLRSGTTCGGSRDILMSVDISNVNAPQILREIDCKTPYGLTVKDSLLYVANGWNGMSLYKCSNPYNLELIKSWDTYYAQDFIWDRDILYVMGLEDIKILDVADPLEPKTLTILK